MGSEERAVSPLEHLVARVAQGLASEIEPSFFDSLVRNLAESLPADYAFAGTFTQDEKRIVEIAAFGDGSTQPHGEFERAGTPFQNLTAQRNNGFSYPESAMEMFPGDPVLRKVAGEGYVGAPLVDSKGRLVGVIAVITRRGMDDPKAAEQLLHIFASRAARELELGKRIEALERQTAEFRRSSEEGATSKSSLERDCAYLRDEIRSEHPPGIGTSPEFRTLMNHVRRVAGTSGTVLILGEPGSGKELAARAVHNMSARRSHPLVKLDCAAIPPDSIEVELFGGLRDARTDVAPRTGRLEVANEGTLLLDEVAELPLEVQGKLLRVIQQREFRPLSSPRTIKVDIRLLATTSRDLDRAVKEERFRIDLYQRLVVDTVPVPPLSRRRQDIPALTEYFLGLLERRLGKKGLRVSSRMMSQMMSYPWPGNIRELKQVLYRAALNAEEELDMPVQAAPASWPEPVTLHEAERHHVIRTLEGCNWVIEGPRGAAAALKVPPSTLRSLMKRLHIQRVAKTPAN